MIKEFPDQSPNELNSILEEKYGFGLFPFADILGTLLWMHHKGGAGVEMPLLKKATEISSLTLRDQQKRIQSLKNKTMEVLAGYRFSIEGKSDLRAALRRSKREAEALIGRQYKIENLFALFNRELLGQIDAELTFRRITRKKSAPIKPINLLIGMWVLLIQCRNRYSPAEGIEESPFSGHIDWEFLADLYRWFWKKLAPYEFYLPLKPPKELSPEDIKNRFYRHRKKWAVYFGFFRGISLDAPGVIIYFREDGVEYSNRNLDNLEDEEVFRRFFSPFISDAFSRLIVFPDSSYLSV